MEYLLIFHKISFCDIIRRVRPFQTSNKNGTVIVLVHGRYLEKTGNERYSCCHGEGSDVINILELKYCYTIPYHTIPGIPYHTISFILTRVKLNNSAANISILCSLNQKQNILILHYFEFTGNSRNQERMEKPFRDTFNNRVRHFFELCIVKLQYSLKRTFFRSFSCMRCVVVEVFS